MWSVYHIPLLHVCLEIGYLASLKKSQEMQEGIHNIIHFDYEYICHKYCKGQNVHCMKAGIESSVVFIT